MNVEMQALEIVDLEELVFGDDCKCESLHSYTPYCDGSVSYRLSACRSVRLVCKSTIDDPMTGTRVRREIERCRDCNRPASECWTIRPI